MQTRRLQQLFAIAAILMLPWPALRPMEQSITWGDLLLIPAILLNLDQLGKLRGWQIPMLLSVPLLLISQVADPDGSIINIGQSLYLFAVVLPFGWVAFVGMRPRVLITWLMISMCISASVAGLQLAGVIGTVGQQSIWSLFGGATRSAGLNISCSGLCLAISPIFALLLYVPSHRKRMLFLLVLSVGLMATLAKSCIFALVGLTYYIAREPNRRGVMAVGLVLIMGTVGLFLSSSSLRKTADMVYTTLAYRVDKAGGSLYERTSTLRFALSYVPRCAIVGMGSEGTAKELRQHLGNTVHVFHLGVVLVAGLPAAMLHWAGIGLLINSTWRSGQHPAAMMLCCHMLALCTMTMLMTSFQYVPFMICAAILNHQLMQNEQHAARTLRLSHAARSPQRAAA